MLMKPSFFRKRKKVLPLQVAAQKLEIEESKDEKFSIFEENSEKLEGNTCCCIGKTCCCRTFLFDLCYNPVTKVCRTYLTILNTAFFVYISQYGGTDLDFTLINYFCLFLLTIDVLFQILALGLYRGRHTFLGSDIWNAIDLLIVICGWVLIYFVWLTPFRVVVFFRYIAKLPFLNALQAILHSFWAVIPKLRGLFVLIIVVYLIFVLTGVDLFKGDIGRRCVYIKEDSLVSSQNTTITTLQQLKDLEIKYEEVIPTTWCSHVGFGISCDRDAHFYCMDENEDYYFGVGSFDTWPQSLVVSFQMISLSGWSKYYIALRGVEGWVIPLIWIMILLFWIVFVVFNIVISAIENAFGLKQEHMMFEASKTKDIPNQTLFSRIFSDYYRAFGGCVLYFLQRRIYCYDCFCGARMFFVSIITSYGFDILVTAVITTNILLEFFLPDGEFSRFVSLGFMVMYLIESSVKICLIGPHYFNSFYNFLDTILVLTAMGLYVIAQTITIGDEVYSTLYVIRLVRTLSILSRFPITRGFMKKVTYSVVPAISLIFFSGCVLFIFANLANMIYRKMSRNYPRGFDSIAESMLTLFVMLTGDNWEENMYDPLSRDPDGKEEKQLYKDNPQLNESKMYFAVVFAGPFFIIFFIMTNLFLLNFFTAVVLNSYANAKDEGNVWSNFKKNIKKIFLWIKNKVCRIDKSKKKEDDDEKKKKKWIDFNPCKSCCGCLRWLPGLIRKSRLYYFFMLSFSLLAVVVLVFDDLPTVDRSQGYPIKFWMFVVDCVLLGVFFIDIVLGVLAEGTKFVANVFHLLDILFLWELTITLSFEIITSRSIPWTIVYIRMVVRCIRPLKVVVQFPDLRIYLNSIRNMIQSFIQLSILLVIVFLIYGIIGNKIFKDKYVTCSDQSKFELDEYIPKEINYFKQQCRGSFIEPIHEVLVPRAFYKLHSNFDNLGSSILTLSELATLDDWSVEMYYVTEQTKDNYAGFYSLYFISFVVIVVFFVITISIGIVLGGIMEERDVDETTTPLQLHWAYMRRYIYIAHPKPKRQPLCGKYICCFPMHWTFKFCVFIVICCNYLVISIQWYNQNLIQEFVVNTLSFFCVLLFCVEDIMKLLATGYANFLSDLWNQIDLLILLLSPVVLGFLLYYQIQTVVNSGVTDFEFMRLYLKGVTRLVLFLRLFAFATSFQSVRRIFRTLVLAIPSIVNACILLICIMFGYALLGRMIFGSVRLGLYYNQHVNFRSWDRSALLLLKMLTFDDWRGVMHDLAIESPYCNNEPTFNDCGSAWMSYFYFVSCGMIISILTLNLFIGIILDNFSIEFLESGFHITRKVVDDFKECWSEFDSNALGLIKLKRMKELIPLLLKKKHVLGFDMENSRGNTMFWIVYHELQRKGGMDEFKTEKEIKETKYLFRSNLLLSLYNFFRKSRKRCWRCFTCFKCCGICEDKKIKLVKRDSLKVSFNDVLLALARISMDSLQQSQGNQARSLQERKLRRLFLEEALDAISSRKFTRSKTDIRMVQKLKRNQKKNIIIRKLKRLRKKKLKSKKQILLEDKNLKKQKDDDDDEEFDVLMLNDLKDKEEEEEIRVLNIQKEKQELKIEFIKRNEKEEEEEEYSEISGSDVDQPQPPPSPLVYSDLGEMEEEEEENEENESVSIITD